MKEAEYKIGVKMRTPPGYAVWPSLNTPETKFEQDATSLGKWKLGVRLPASDPATQALIATLEALRQEAIAEATAEAPKKKDGSLIKPIKEAEFGWKNELDKEGEPTGNVIIGLGRKAGGVSKKTGKPWKAFVDLFDAKMRPIDRSKVNIGGGSKVIAVFEASKFSSGVGTGVSLRLNAIQVLELREGGNRDAKSYGFEAQDGFDSGTVEVSTDMNEAREQVPNNTDDDL